MVKIVFPESCKKYVELQCNSVVTDYTDCPEVAAIDYILKTVSPKKVLELGAGLGRVSIYLRNFYGWDHTEFYLLDGNSGEEQIAGLHEKMSNDFYNSLSASADFCVANNVCPNKLFFINAEKHFELQEDIFDLCYSFKSIGFHWPINEYLDIVYPWMRKDGYLFFEVRDTRKNSYPNEKRWKRIKNFVSRQLDGINLNRYRIVTNNTDKTTPVLVLKKL